MSRPLIDIQNITKIYNSHKRNILACKNISLAINKGEFLSIVGESGSGKSTLMKILSNLEDKTSGKIIYKDKDITTLGKKELREHRQEIQLLFQDTSSSLNPKMKVQDIVCEPLLNFKHISKKDVRKKASELLKNVELDDSFLDKRPNEMSGGQRQRVSIARSLALQPKVLILDEPTSALDVVTQRKILQFLKALQEKNDLTIIFVCHDLALVTGVSHRVAVMYQGEIKEIVLPCNLHKDDLDPYTVNLVQSMFDVKKCGCRFDDECVHIEV